MNTFNLILSTLIHLLLLTHTVECTHPTLRRQSVFQALRANGLEAYADFLEQFSPPEISEGKDITLFAPTNEAVKAFLAANPNDIIHRRDAAKNMQVNKNNVGNATAIATLPSKGKVVATGGGGTSGNKVAQPAAAGGGGGGGSSDSGGRNGRRARNLDLGERTQSYIATITAGGGVRTKVLQNSFPFDNGIIYKVDRYVMTLVLRCFVTCPLAFSST